MAVVNPRLLDLIETLVAARLDWLAFELMEGVQVGHSTEDSEEALAAARHSIRSDTQPKAYDGPYAIAAAATSVPAEEQIDWAVAYVEERLRGALEQLDVSIESLNFVVEETAYEVGDAVSVAESTASSKPSAVVVLQDIEGDRKSGSDNVLAARKDLLVLRTALNEWASASRGQAAT